MAPMTGRILHRKQDWPILGFGPGQRLLPPGVPIDGIARMLAQVGASFVTKAIGVRDFCHYLYKSSRYIEFN